MEELFWKYIDGTATEAEILEAQTLLESDKNAVNLYNQLKLLDKSLQQTTMSPSSGFTASVLSRAFLSLQLERASFKPLIYVFSALVGLSLLIAFMPFGNEESSGLIDWSILQFNLELSPQYFIYGLAALSVVLVIWMDVLFQKKKMV